MQSPEEKRRPHPLPLAAAIAPPAEALTFARIRENGRIATLLVVGVEDEGLRAMDIGERFDMPGADPLDILSNVGHATLVALTESQSGSLYSAPDFLPAAGPGVAEIAVGTNYPEHGEEVGIGTVFLFPKFAAATPPLTTIAVGPEMLLDYEVEICTRFDRDIAMTEDFDAASIGFFLCGDMTDRAVLMRKMDIENPASGLGFTDAKSGEGRFPCGPFLVVPADWRDFIAHERIQTRLDGTVRQDALGGDMIMDLRALVTLALRDGREARWRYRGKPVLLFSGSAIPKGTAILTGTPDGILFRPPGSWDKMTGFFAWLLGDFASGRTIPQTVVDRYIASLRAQGDFLHAGQEVSLRSGHLGEIALRVDARP